jgi:hypothetical protein
MNFRARISEFTFRKSGKQSNRSWQQMVNGKLTRTGRALAMTILVIAGLSGCGQTTDWIKGRINSGPEKTGESGVQEVDSYITELGQIASGDPAAQAEIFADASAAAQLTPSPSTNLRFGLVLAIPGHPESDPERAQSILREVLAQTILLTPAEISLATIHLNNAQRQIVADSEARRLRSSTSRATETQQQALRQRLTSVEAENLQLRQDLEEAEKKLEAITNIERSIREQE